MNSKWYQTGLEKIVTGQNNYPKAKVLICPQCAKKMYLRESKIGPYYCCEDWPKCKTRHGAHPDGLPMGVPGDEKTRNMRIEAHKAFNQLFEKVADRVERKRRKGKAYLWLSKTMGIPVQDCHIADFSVEQCETVIEEAKTKLQLLEKGFDDFVGGLNG